MNCFEFRDDPPDLRNQDESASPLRLVEADQSIVDMFRPHFPMIIVDSDSSWESESDSEPSSIDAVHIRDIDLPHDFVFPHGNLDEEIAI